MDYKSRGVVVFGAPLSRYHIALTKLWLPNIDQAILEDGRCISEDEVYGAINVAVLVKLLPLGHP